ncbi:hypothetical protein, partial [Salmonella enterica]|uniref:hypothetical protein n=1 Tax=Salmonella enterica TaxID=28901 RepID=UPI00359392DC
MVDVGIGKKRKPGAGPGWLIYSLTTILSMASRQDCLYGALTFTLLFITRTLPVGRIENGHPLA